MFGLANRTKTVTVSPARKKLLVSSTSCHKRTPNCVSRYKFFCKNISPPSDTFFPLLPPCPSFALCMSTLTANIQKTMCYFRVTHTSPPLLVLLFNALVAYRCGASYVTMSAGGNNEGKSQIESLFFPSGCDFARAFVLY